ncbi:MAG: AAA family ATPase, partial [Candidatus Atribacteria bacterium]|nr:AAA family ATPase [Candidatus Atribacteria bacterium]
KTDETLKLTGPSPLRDVITFVMKKVVKTSESFESLNKAFGKFNNRFREEASKDGFSLSKLKREINYSLKEWEVEFNLNINPIRPEGIIKNLVSHYVIDKNLDEEIDVKYLGQGLQRHLIYTLLKLSSQYTEKKTYKKKEFSPELTLILFEEPEAFLHPGQQEFLNTSLRLLSSEEGQQITVATHSPIFVSKNIEDISALVKLRRGDDGVTRTFQVSEDTQKTIIEQNSELAQLLQSKLDDPLVDKSIKNGIRKILGDTEEATRMEEESIRYLLWLDSDRCCAFFTDIVLICEGATEKIFIDYLIKNKWENLREKRIYILDAMGKFNIHRYMNLFKELGIYHSVLADKDEDRNVQEFINQFIEDRKNEFTRSIDFFDKDIETFLDIKPPPSNRKDKKPLNVMWHYFKGKISTDNIDALKGKVEGLLQR